mgnify:FL=1
MRKMGDLMAELGFKDGADEKVQAAFLKNLVRAAYGAEVKTLPVRSVESKRQSKKVSNGASAHAEDAQLKFKFDE